MADELETMADIHAAEQTAQAVSTTETREPEADTTAETETAATPETTTATAESQAETEESIRDWIKENLDYDATKYQSDDEALRGLVETAKKVGLRDADAEYGRQFRQLVQGREAQVLALLQSNGQGNGQDKTPTATKTNEAPEYDPAWEYQITRDDKGRLVPVENAPADVVQKYQRYGEWAKQQFDRLARQKPVDEVLAERLADIDYRIQETVARQLGQHSVSNALQTWEAEHRTAIYANGKDETGGLTPIGQEITTREAQLRNLGVADPIARLNDALEYATLKHQKVTPAGRKLPGKVIRQPAIAAVNHDADKTDDELLETMTMAELFAYRQKHPA